MFSAVILQRDKSIHTSSDIRHTIDCRLSLWDDEKFDLVVQEAVQCDHSLAARYKRHKPNDDHVLRVFTRHMLQGKVRAAMRWLTERFKGHVLDPNDQVTLHINGQDTTVNVIKALQLKHPAPVLPHSSTLLEPDHLPELEDLDITGSHIHQVALRIQGSAGPGGCDSTHWQVITLRYGSSSRCL